MRILLLGAGGFIGRAILGALMEAGHEVTGIVRQAGGLREAFPQARFCEIDLARATAASDWAEQVIGIDQIVNASGLLSGAELEAVHVAMPRALAEAARREQVQRIVLISAISARPEVATDYARTKLAGEDDLRRSGVNWTILRPSLVYGDGSYGGTSLLRGLAALPLAVPLPGQGDYPFTPIHCHDLAHAVVRVCENARFAGQTLEPAGPETLTLRELLVRYRSWLGFAKARFVPIPLAVMRGLGRLGDLAGKGPVATNSLVQMIVGNAGDPKLFRESIGFSPRALETALRTRPAQVQDRWHARLFFLAPAITAVLVALWLVSAWLGFTQGQPQAEQVVAGLGLPGVMATPLRLGGCALDLGVAALVLSDRRGRWSTMIQLALVAGYTLVIDVALPSLWLDPLGPLLKNLPILALVAVHGVLVDAR